MTAGSALGIRPAPATGTLVAYHGTAVGSLYLGNHDFRMMLADGELCIGSESSLRHIREQWQR